MADIFHMNPDLVSASCFQRALNEGYIAESLNNFIVCNGIFAMLTIRIGFKDFSESLVSSDMRNDCALVFFQVPPYEGNVFPAHGVVKKLFCQAGHPPAGFSNHHKTAGIFIYSMHETEAVLRDGHVESVSFISTKERRKVASASGSNRQSLVCMPMVRSY